MAVRRSLTGWNDREAIDADLRAEGFVKTILYCVPCGAAQVCWHQTPAPPLRPCMDCDGPTVLWSGQPVRHRARPPKPAVEPL